MMHIYSLSVAGPNDMLFAGQTCVRRKNHVLAAVHSGASWQIRLRTPRGRLSEKAEPIEMLFRGLTHAGSVNLFVGRAHWCHLVNTIEPSAISYRVKGSSAYRPTARACATVPIPSSAAYALQCHTKFTPVKIPHAMRPFVKIIWPLLTNYWRL